MSQMRPRKGLYVKRGEFYFASAVGIRRLGFYEVLV